MFNSVIRSGVAGIGKAHVGGFPRSQRQTNNPQAGRQGEPMGRRISPAPVPHSPTRWPGPGWLAGLADDVPLGLGCNQWE